MRRFRRSYFRPFAHGLLLASIPVAAFLGVDYLIAPPATERPEPSRVSVHGGNAGTEGQAAGPSSVAQQVANSPLTAARPTTTGGAAQGTRDARGALVSAIQAELIRVGCYAGSADGAWSERTRAAMRAFNSSVRVTLATDQPDYILLTLLQGHSSKACSRSCEAEAGGAQACVDKSIEARTIKAPPAAQPTAPAATAAAPLQTWSTTVVLSSPGKVVEAPIRGSTTPPVAVGARSGREASSAPAAGAASPQAVNRTGPQVADTAATSEPLPGRMAIGVLPPAPAEAAPVVDGGPIAAIPRPDRAVEQPIPRGRPATGSTERQRPPPASAGGSSRLSRTFSELGRNSP